MRFHQLRREKPFGVPHDPVNRDGRRGLDKSHPCNVFRYITSPLMKYKPLQLDLNPLLIPGPSYPSISLDLYSRLPSRQTDSPLHGERIETWCC
jgi:hypothetical protein